MNSNIILIRDKQSYISDQIISEANPKEKTILQFSYYDRVIVSKAYKKNISIPRIPYIDYLYFPNSYKLLSHVCTTNDFQTNILKQYDIDAIKLDININRTNDTLNISSAYKNYYKFGAILNFKEDILVIEDLLYLFYESNKDNHNRILLLMIESGDSNGVLSLLNKVHQQLDIKQPGQKILLIIRSNIEDSDRILMINTIDCLLQLNSIFISDLEYYYCIAKNKRIISKYNLDNMYSIDKLPCYKKIFRFYNQYNFFDQYDHHALYESLKKTDSQNQKFIEKNNTGISNLL